MIAVRTQFGRSELADRDLAPLREAIERAVPLSAGHDNRRVVATAEPRIAELKSLAAASRFDPASYTGHWRLQLGSLGSGNHFIEASVDEFDRVWMFLHSGSRGVGNKIATHHIGDGGRCRPRIGAAHAAAARQREGRLRQGFRQRDAVGTPGMRRCPCPPWSSALRCSS